MSDIDLLVASGDEQKSRSAMARAGFHEISHGPLESTWREAGSACDPLTAMSVQPGDPWAVDLHTSLDVLGPPGAVAARLACLPENRIPCAHLPPAKQLGQPALLLHLAAHAGSGFHNLTLLRLIEIILVARADYAAGLLDWDELVTEGRRVNGLAFAYPAFDLARRLSSDDIPRTVVDACAAEAPAAVRRLVAGLRPASAHRIDRPTIREHYAWTTGAAGWIRRVAADIAPAPKSMRRSAEIHAARARGLLHAAIG